MGFCDQISYVRQISSCKSIWLASTVTYVDQHTNSCSASHRSLFSTPFVGHVPYLWGNVVQRSDLQPERCITFAPWPCPKRGVICGFNYLLLCVGCPDDDDDEDDDEDKDEGDGDDEDEENDYVYYFHYYDGDEDGKENLQSFICMKGHTNHKFVCSFIDSFIHSLIHSFIYSFVHLFIHFFVRSFIHSLSDSFIHFFVRSFIHSLSDSFIHFFVRSFIHSFIE